jgi:hypothetical protein
LTPPKVIQIVVQFSHTQVATETERVEKVSNGNLGEKKD